MRVVTVAKDLMVPFENGRCTIVLAPGVPYVMHDVEAESGREAGVLCSDQALPPQPARFDPARAARGRLIVPFIGGMGDAVSMLPVLASIREQQSGLGLDVAATPGPAGIFRLSPRVDDVVAYPVPLEEWRRSYQHYLTLEAVGETAQAPGRAIPETFAAALGVPLTTRRFELSLPLTIRAVDERPAVPLVGVAVGDSRTLRSYPQSMLRELIADLVRRDLCCVLLGHADPSWNIPVCPPVITDMRSRTPTVLELAVWLRAVDVVVCHDSFVMHLAGAMQRPTVAMFAPTSRRHASDYEATLALVAAAPCSPCHQTAGICPLGHDRCMAWESSPVSPSVVAEAVIDQLRLRGRLIDTRAA